MNDLIKEFEDIVLEASNLIKNKSIVALKHVATGKYLSSIRNLCYTTGSRTQLIFVDRPGPGPNSLWKIGFGKEFASYNDTFITLQHIKSGNSLRISKYEHSDYYTYRDHRGHYIYHKSPLTEHTEVSCDGGETGWKFSHSKFENHKGYLKSNDIIYLSIRKVYDVNGYTQDGQVEFLRSHDIQFTIGNDGFQEVVCHSERLGGNDEWCIELIKQHI